MPSWRPTARGDIGDRGIPWRTTFAVIGAVLVSLGAVLLVWELRRIVTWLLVACLLAVGLAPPVAWVQRHLHLRRGLAILVVFIVGLALLTGAVYIVVQPLVAQAEDFIDALPDYVNDAEEGRGTIGRLVDRLNLEEWVRENSDSVSSAISQGGGSALDILKAISDTVVGLVTILVLTILLLMEAPAMIENGLASLPPSRRDRIVRVAADCSRAVSGYVAGNLLISVIAGSVTFITLTILGVPFAAPLAVWVAIADLIPLVGATLGAIPAVTVAFIYSVPAGIITLIVYVLYQQFENHVLQVTIMSRTVALNPLLVLISVLIGVELLGIVGALVAIPAGGILQVIVRDIYHERKIRLGEPEASTEPETVTEVSDAAAAATLGIDEDEPDRSASR
jgi:predicted PurR-regulated permease PerM